MHSFSPLRFDPAKQMSFALSKSSQSHAQYASAPLRKTCARLESLPCRTVWRFGTRMHTESTWRFGTMPRRTALRSAAPFRRRNCAVAHQQTDANTTATGSIRHLSQNQKPGDEPGFLRRNNLQPLQLRANRNPMHLVFSYQSSVRWNFYYGQVSRRESLPCWWLSS